MHFDNQVMNVQKGQNLSIFAKLYGTKQIAIIYQLS